ncbi:MAG: DDE-type integrase/transposase/recombinase [Candidatus Thiodiazotropha taylori]|nr:DDE-type integrase/transposase/recombinase [Candidatus Thiodiazotropha taylori]
MGQRWTAWLKSFHYFATGSGVTEKTQKRALLLHMVGPNVQEIFETLPDRGGNGDFDKAVDALNLHFKPKANVPYERHVFRQSSQKEDETVEQFATRLRKLALTCEFGDTKDDAIRDQIIDKCKSNDLRRRFLRDKDLKLDKLLDIGRSYEAADMCAAKMERPTSLDVNRIESKGRKPQGSFKSQRYSGQGQMICSRCGRSGHTGKRCVVTKGKKCHKCHQEGHFQKCCRTKMKKDKAKQGKSKVHVLESDSESTDEHCFVIGNKLATVNVNIAGQSINLLIDSGASCNVIDSDTWKMLKTHVKMTKCDRKVYAYGAKSPLHVLGKFETDISINDQTKTAEFLVVDTKCGSILGCKTATDLNILHIGPPTSNINAVKSDNIFRQKYPELFKGIGKLNNYELTIHIDKNVKPIAQPIRRLPFKIREKVDKKLEELEAMDIIEPVSGPSHWVSPLVAVPKPNGDVRVCVDMRRANEAVQRERHPIPTVDEILHDLNEATVFSKLDLVQGYHQIILKDDGSRDITTFVTNKGLYRYKRLNFGISSASEMYQHVIEQVLHGCEGTRNISDDIIVHGKTKEEHDHRVCKVLERLKERGLTLNADKCKFSMDKLVFMGHVLSRKGIAPEKVKVEAILNAKEPENASEVRSFLGLVNFNARFIPDLSTVAEPLRRLTKNNVEFKWGPEQSKSFSLLKERLTNAETLGYFNPNAKTMVIADASPVGLGAVLVQQQNGEQRIISYASRTLTDVEKRYSQTEKEALALVWACERFSIYLIGIDFELITDHKPLEVIYGKTSKPSARIERMVLRLQPYRFTVKYKSGRSNIADPLSRLTQGQTEKSQVSKVAEEYIRFMTVNAVPGALTAHDIELESGKDPEMKLLRYAIRHNNWTDVPEYKHVRNELTFIGKLVLRGTRIVIPSSMRKCVLEIGHEGHQGIVKTKAFLRESVWWPGIDTQAERLVRQCHACQLVSQPTKPEPMSRTQLPEGPWQHLALDLMGPFPSGDHVLVVVDYYSRWYEIALLKTITSSKIINCLNKMFCTHGLPLSVTCDNAPQLVSEEMKDYLKHNGIQQHLVTPYYAQANGEVERQNRSLLKAIKTLQIEKGDWRKELDKYLLSYRATPHSCTQKSPAEMMFKRKIRTKLPYLVDIETDLIGVRDRDSSEKEKGKQYADQKRSAEPSNISSGDKVLLEQKHENKLSTRFEQEPYLVRKKIGNQVVMEGKDGGKIKRNVIHVKKYEDNVITGEQDVDRDNASTAATPVTIPVPVETNVRPKRETRRPKYLEDYVTT